jgi:hypothetical protein
MATCVPLISAGRFLFSPKQLKELSMFKRRFFARIAAALALTGLVLSSAACASLSGGGEASVSPRHATLKEAGRWSQ